MEIVFKTRNAIAPLFATAFAFLTAAAAPADTSLVMAEEAGCMWCARWNAEVAPEYPKTAEGRAAPLRRIDKTAPVPDDLTLDGPVRFTPTFILVRDGQEIDRIEGYPGEDFFWPLLQRMLMESGIEYDAAG
ncbi:hypothetical protein P1J78_04670 [Psychromarinibacter sp. C21-152]|uniref:Regulatory protein SoxS n=1 Tax=Psychromarinibacter sediminicola TaxID=3033385 RepID=A0AAE3NLB3_9RHOB|nr:hypothetical protein [Psychromarinibacter sediminicola]MDF0600018.1 hypothetical protein [Psychromarinibacter sediminicola]